jgi:predicted nucleic acid-binding protein
MIQEAQSLGLVSSNPAKTLGHAPSQVKQLTRYAEDVEDLLSGDFTVIETLSSDFIVALHVQQKFGLLTNDSLNIAVMKRLALTAFSTADSQFDAVSDITVYKPDDL